MGENFGKKMVLVLSGAKEAHVEDSWVTEHSELTLAMLPWMFGIPFPMASPSLGEGWGRRRSRSTQDDF